MKSKLLAATLIAVPVLVALKPLADSVLFQPEDGSSSSKEYSTSASFVLGDFSALMDGMDMSELGGGEEIEALFATEINPQLMELMDSLAAQCEYAGTQDIDGKTLGVIKVTLEGEGDIDLTGVIRGLAESQIPPEVEVELSIDEAAVTITLEGEGELL